MAVTSIVASGLGVFLSYRHARTAVTFIGLGCGVGGLAVGLGIVWVVLWATGLARQRDDARLILATRAAAFPASEIFAKPYFYVDDPDPQRRQLLFNVLVTNRESSRPLHLELQMDWRGEAVPPPNHSCRRLVRAGTDQRNR